MKPLEFNVRGLKQLLARGYQKKALATYFMVSRPYLDHILNGTSATPHPGVAQFVNARIDHLLSKRGG
ncbi:MAG: hypothetical protein KGI71_06480 [Patescibacteria group bacterium]|nr:hypothetical protein [Patescibacteria group bacterium]